MDDVSEKRFRELANRAFSQGTYVFTHFLDLAGLSAFQSLIPSLPPVPYMLFGGAEGCERQMLRFGSEDFCGYDMSFPIVCLKITPVNPKFAEKLTHRDYLGALMAQGIERELLGDIIVREDTAYLFCEEKIAPYLADNFTQARHTALRCTAVDALPEGELFKTQRMSVQLSSERLDALIAHVHKISRSEAQALFPIGKIYVNGRLCQSPGHTPKENDLISVRGYGRMRYKGVESLSKKGKCNSIVEIYI